MTAPFPTLSRQQYALLFLYRTQAALSDLRARASWRMERHGPEHAAMTLPDAVSELLPGDLCDGQGRLTEAGKGQAWQITIAPLPRGQENGF